MKITIVQGAFLPVPALLGGAVEKVWCALGREFAARGHKVTHLSRQYRNLPTQEIICGVRHRRVPGFEAPRSLLYLKVLDFLYSARARRFLPTADVLVTNTFWLPILMRDPCRGKVYIHVARYPKGQMRFYSRAARLQTVSQPVAEAIEREAPKLAARVRVIPYPVIDNGSTGGPNAITNERKQQILFVGRVHQEKGVHLLLKAVSAISRKDLTGWRVVIVGPSEVRLGGGGATYLRQLRGLVQPIADLVDWVGPIFDSAELSLFYRRASIFVYPSLADRGETFGLAPLEAMSHGCAPVVSQLPCFRDFIQDGVDGLFFNHFSKQAENLLADRLLALMRDDQARARIGEAARLRSLHYDLGRISAAFLEDFAGLLQQPANSPSVTAPYAQC